MNSNANVLLSLSHLFFSFLSELQRLERSCCQRELVQELVSRKRVSNCNMNNRRTHIYGFSSTSRFKQPYPPTHWCAVPVEDQTNKALCRPLPVDRLPPPPRVEPPGNACFTHEAMHLFKESFSCRFRKMDPEEKSKYHCRST